MVDWWREVVVDWLGDLAFAGRNADGGTVRMGTFEGNPGISPMELLLVGVAGCTGVDVVNILRKKRQPLQNFQLRVRGSRAETDPKVFKVIEVVYLLWGDGIKPKAVEQAIKLSEEKYCSASAMLRSTAELRSSYQILGQGDLPRKC